MIYTFKIKVEKEIELQANSEDSAWDKLEEFINTEYFEENIELSDIDDRDEVEAEERAKARWESLQEDIAVENYYERKYGNGN